VRSSWIPSRGSLGLRETVTEEQHGQRHHPAAADGGARDSPPDRDHVRAAGPVFRALDGRVAGRAWWGALPHVVRVRARGPPAARGGRVARADSGTACRLANSTTFQRLAWHGTEAAKKAGKDGTEAVKNSALYRTGQYKAMEQMNRLKQTEAFKEVESSAAFKTLSEVKTRVVEELKQTRLK
jgi:hypothetical protein